MFVSAVLQLSLISSAQWSTLSDRFLADTTAASKPVDLSRNSVDSTTTFDKPQLSRLNSVATEAATSLNHSSDWEDDDLLATSSGVAYQKIKCE